MDTRISVIVPNHNGSATIGTCLNALFSSQYRPLEVIVVDDCSSDQSVEIIHGFPCRLIRVEHHSGASKARNTGAAASAGDALFFIDADCVVRQDTLHRVAEAFRKAPDVITGGTYAPLAFDHNFFSNFQSVFIHYSELKQAEPDYIATHAMVIGSGLFQESGGFPEDFMPILEDVEYSHRMKRAGTALVMNGSILVSHIFNYGLRDSLGNAFRKSKYWTAYSIRNRDLLSDSGTASMELKYNVLSAAMIWSLLLCYIVSDDRLFLFIIFVAIIVNLSVSRHLIGAFFHAGGYLFGIRAVLYYTLLYPFAVAAGGASGMLMHLRAGRKST